MKAAKSNKKITTFLALGLFVLVGTYNAVVINSESHLSTADAKFVKRLDEMYGVTVSGRQVAASVVWEKLPAQSKIQNIKKVMPSTIVKTNTPSPAASDDVIPAAAVQEELSLTLVEVINPKKWQNGLPAGQFNGALNTNNGVIESLSVSLPNNEGVSVSFSEMTGNVFEYDLNGEIYSGMMYQVEEKSYMVTLTNGPLEGTRLRFSTEAPAVEQANIQEALAENNIQPGNFGEEANTEVVNQINQTDEELQAQGVKAQSFNF